jgi:hypothetical protein
VCAKHPKVADPDDRRDIVGRDAYLRWRCGSSEGLSDGATLHIAQRIFLRKGVDSYILRHEMGHAYAQIFNMPHGELSANLIAVAFDDVLKLLN